MAKAKMKYERINFGVFKTSRKMGVLSLGKQTLGSCIPERTALEIVRRYNNFKESEEK